MGRKPLTFITLASLCLILVPLSNAGSEPVPVILFFPDDHPIEVSGALKRAANLGNPDPQPAVEAQKLIEKREAFLMDRAAEAARLGLNAPRRSIAANAVMGWYEEGDVSKLASSLGAADWMVDRVLDAQMNASVPTMLPQAFYDAGFSGGVSAFDIGILDAGIDGDHPAFAGLDLRYHIDHTNALSDANYLDSSTNPDDLTYAGHGTHIAGIILGRSAPTWESYVGVAPGTSRLYNLKSGFRRTGSDTAGLYFADALDNIDWGIFQASDDIDLLNFSWGIAASSDDSGLARFFDAMVEDLNIPVVISAGNGGPSSYTIIDPGIAYNVITVGATNDAGTSNRLDDNVTGSSARGPTLGGRKKPDLVAPGFLIQSPTNFWESNFDYSNVSGTSFAAPHVVGAAQLIMDYFGPSVDPLQVKALLIGSASPGSFFESGASVEWDAKWGWGYVNLDRAWDYRQSVFLHSVAPAGQSGDYKLYRGPMERVSRAALVWNRHVNYVTGGGQPSTAGTLNDLNLRVYDHEDGTLLDSSTSGIDNVEVVSITLRDYETVVKVSAADSSFSRVSLESYGLSTPPGFVFPDTLPRPRAEVYVTNEDPMRVVAFLENTGDFNAHGVETYLDLPGGVDFGAGLQLTDQGTIRRNAQERRSITWTLIADAPITGSGSLDLDSNSYGESYDSSTEIAFTGLPSGLRVNFDKPHAIQAGTPFTVSATVTNSSASLAQDVSITLIHIDDLQIFSGAETIVLGELDAGGEATAQWTISIPQPASTVYAIGSAEGRTAGGGLLGGSSVLTVSTPDHAPDLVLEVLPLGPTHGIETGSGIEYRAQCTNLGPGDAESAYATLEVPSGFVLVSGSERQNIGPLASGETKEAGRWLILAPQTAQNGVFRIALDDDGDIQSSTRFQVSVGQPPPPPPSAFPFILQDDPLLQDWTGSSDNDPAGLCLLPDGSYVFFNGQPGGAIGHEAIIRFDPSRPGTSALSVVASRTALQGILGSKESFTVDALVADDMGNVYALLRILRSSGKDPRHLVGISRSENGAFASVRTLVPPGLPPHGILFNDSLERTGLCWDSTREKLLILIDNGELADDLTRNGIYTVDPESGFMQIYLTYAELSTGLTPQPVPGSDPIGFTSMAVDHVGNVYLLNSGGLGGNVGDLIRVTPAGVPLLHIDDSTLQVHLPQSYTEFPVRLLPSPSGSKLAILVVDELDTGVPGEGLLTEWDAFGSFLRVRATRSQLLTATGAGFLTCPAGAAKVDNAGNYHLWSTRDNETLLVVPNLDALVGESITIY